MNLRYGSIYFLRFLVAMLVLLMLASLAAAYWIRTQSQKKILLASELLEEKDLARNELELCLRTLYKADNQFRLYTLTFDPEYSRAFRHELNKLDSLFQSVSALMTRDMDQLNEMDTIETRSRQRELLMHKMGKLRSFSDSMLKVAVSYDSVVTVAAKPGTAVIREFRPERVSSTADTLEVSSSTVKKKKGFFAKVKSFFKGETDTIQSKKQIASRQTSDTAQVNGDMLPAIEELKVELAVESNNYYQNQLRLQFKLREELRQKEISLIRLNASLVEGLSSMLQHLIEEAVLRRDQIRNLAAVSVREQSGIMAVGLFITLGLVLILTIFIILTISRIIRYQRQIIQARIRAEEEAAEKGRFLAYMSHELRTPLTSIVGFAEQMKQTSLDNKQEQYIRAMLSSSDILLTTINDILDFSKLETGRLKFYNNPFFPVSIFEQVISSLRPMANNKGLEIRFVCRTPAPLVLLGDEMRLKQVLINLINNAIKYSEKGTITVMLSHTPEGNRMNLLASVRDEGIGIAREHLSEVFREYSQVHEQTSGKWIIGTGLGLPICKRIVEQQGGSISVTSEKGVGSEFSFAIPFEKSEQAPASNQPMKPFDDQLFFEGKEVLVVDDTEINLVLLESILTSAGMKIHKTRNGEEALAALEEQRFHMVLTDVFMPVMDGLELTARIRKSGRPWSEKLPVIILTANIVQDEIDRFRAAGVNDYMMKPFRANDLLKMMKKYL